MYIADRDLQLLELHRLLTASDRRDGAIALLSGPTAVGKTTLLHEFTRRAADSGALVLRAAGSRQESIHPLGVIRQLLNRVRLSDAAARSTRDALDAGIHALATIRQKPGMLDWAMDELCYTILELAEESTVVLAIDDVHEADHESLRCLGYVARRLFAARILGVFTERPYTLPSYSATRADFARQPGVHQLRVGALTLQDVSELLTDRLGTPATGGMAEACHAASGGNPLLVRALIDDTHRAMSTGEVGAHRLVAGELFDSAVVDCVHRIGAASAGFARQLAVLGPNALAALLDESSTNEHAQLLQELAETGLLTGLRFRHPKARTALSALVSAEDRAGLHRRAALLLYDKGAEPRAVADHIAAAGGIDEPWAVALLQDAATQALAEDDFHNATRLFDLAYAMCPEGQLKASILYQRTLCAWQIDPAMALRWLPELKKAISVGHLTAESGAMSLIKNLIWQGCADEAADVVKRLDRQLADDPSEDALAEIRALRLWLSALCPPLHEQIFGDLSVGAGREISPADVAAQPRFQAAEALSVVLRGGEAEKATVGAEHVLQISALTPTLETIPLALMTLFYADRTEQIEFWSTTLLSAARERNTPTWEAILSSLQAANLARQGRLSAAEECCDLALARMSSRGWGLSIGLPLASSVYSLTAMGRYEEAQARLSHPLPDAIFQTLFGQHYLYARGQFYLATGRLQAALGDFLACGRALESWGIDHTTLIAWRTGVAETRLRLSETEQAVAFLEEELALHLDHPQVHGNALRLLASTAEPKRRLQMLKQAADELQAAGSEFQLAQALGDLSCVYHLLGQSNRARVIVRRAYRLAKKCHAEPLSRSLMPDAERATAGNGCAAKHRPSDQAQETLSEAELRVAALAADGHTNREIARRLFITISTVEQHMTRVLRKLDVSRRSDLPLGLDATCGSTSPAVSGARG